MSFSRQITFCWVHSTVDHVSEKLKSSENSEIEHSRQSSHCSRNLVLFLQKLVHLVTNVKKDEEHYQRYRHDHRVKLLEGDTIENKI